MVPMTVGAPLDRVAIDILGERPETTRGNRYILVLSDYFTKWAEAYPIPNQTAMTVADVIAQQFIGRFGAPRNIHSDQGRNFESELFHQLCSIFGIKKQRTTPHHPQCDGVVERFNRTLLQMLRTVVNDQGDEWDEHLAYVTAAYRHTKHETTGYSPFQLMFGRPVTVPLDLMIGCPPRTEGSCTHEYVVWLQESIQQAHQCAWKNTRKAAERQKNYFDARFNPYHFQIGEFVWRHNPFPGRRKLSKAWNGPYKVVDIPNSHHCLIQRKPDDKIMRVHCDQLKVYRGRKPKGWGVVLRHDEEEREICDSSSPGGQSRPSPEPESTEDIAHESIEDVEPESISQAPGSVLASSDSSSDEEREEENRASVVCKPLSTAPLGRGKRTKRPPHRYEWD